MKKYINILFFLFLSVAALAQERIDLSGRWKVKFDGKEADIDLPGSMITAGLGDKVGPDTKWTADVWDTLTCIPSNPLYTKYFDKDNYKITWWLTPQSYYVGKATYTRDIDVPEDFAGKAARVSVERGHFSTELYIDGKCIGMSNFLGAPQEFELEELTPGKHQLRFVVDNSVKDINPGINASSITDQTQGNWNGLVGSLKIEALEKVRIDEALLNPRLSEKTLYVKVVTENATGRERECTLSSSLLGRKDSMRCSIRPGRDTVSLSIPLLEEVKYWDEFSPNLYTLGLKLSDKDTGIDSEASYRFGCREMYVEDGKLMMNGERTFIRGTLNCCEFPLTGFPSTDKSYWLRELSVLKSFGLNHVRFHSWCPPEAAFDAADELGMTFQIECSGWPVVGDGEGQDDWFYKESDNIVRHFGNHPSFAMMACCNEPHGDHHEGYLEKWVSYWKTKDPRRLYTSGSGWPRLDVNDYHVWSDSRIQQWMAGNTSLINAHEPTTDFDWSQQVKSFPGQPIVSHEIGQWCVFPDFSEIRKYDGAYKANNFEIFKETLEENGLGEYAERFLMASGKLQTLCYKADIEAQMRTRGLGGYQLLGLKDFPGQGTALCGAINVFMGIKPYTSAEEYSHFCNSVVPLARLERLVMESSDTLRGSIEIANYYKALDYGLVHWRLSGSDGQALREGSFDLGAMPTGLNEAGKIEIPMSFVDEPVQMTLEVSFGRWLNSWNIWVYPSEATKPASDIIVTSKLSEDIIKKLQKGAKVLYTIPKGKLSADFGGDIQIGFSSIFWNTSFTNRQAPETLGVLVDPRHPALKEFPTDYYSDYQWWDAMSHSGAMELDKIQKGLKPIVRVVDDWFCNRSLGLVFEAKVGKGSIVVSSIDFSDDLEDRPAGKALLRSLVDYMSSQDFNPQTKIGWRNVSSLESVY